MTEDEIGEAAVYGSEVEADGKEMEQEGRNRVVRYDSDQEMEWTVLRNKPKQWGEEWGVDDLKEG